MSKSVEEVRRAAFRKIFANPPYEFSMARNSDSSAWPGNYQVYSVECAWQGFNEALDAASITLPDEQPGYMYYAPDVLAAIEQTGLGLRVK